MSSELPLAPFLLWKFNLEKEEEQKKKEYESNLKGKLFLFTSPKGIFVT
jgi:hypothetical protein